MKAKFVYEAMEDVLKPKDIDFKEYLKTKKFLGYDIATDTWIKKGKKRNLM